MNEAADIFIAGLRNSFAIRRLIRRLSLNLDTGEHLRQRLEQQGQCLSRAFLPVALDDIGLHEYRVGVEVAFRLDCRQAVCNRR